MVDNNQPLVPMREFAHIGAEVRDLDKAVDFFSKVFGWGPWERQEADRQALLRGKPVKYKALRAWLRTGPVTLEFGATPGESFQHEFLEATGGGLQHISFDVDDVDEVVAKLDKLGIPVLQAGIGADGKYDFAFVDTREAITGNIVIELVRRRK